MPQRTHRFGKSVTELFFLAAALSLLSAVVRRERRQLLLTARARKRQVRVGPRRIAASLAFATLFFAGAALSAGAGNGVVQLLDGESAATAEATTSTGTTTDEALPADPAAPEAAAVDPAAQPTDEAPADGGAASEAPAQPGQSEPAASALPAQSSVTAAVQAKLKQRARGLVSNAGQNSALAPAQDQKHHGDRSDSFHRAPAVLQSQPQAARQRFAREPEADEPGVAATIWLHRALADPTPPSRRLTPAFARRLTHVSARNHVDWALTLAVLRASGERGAAPASNGRLKVLTKRLASLRAQRNAWSSVLALEGRTTFADRTIALQNLYHALGLKALVRGYEWAKPSLSKRILNDSRISIYPGGRSDIQAGRVNVRILALIAYLAEAHGQVTVSCLISGHRLYARPGVVSAHIYGLAADISALDGTSIFGHQQPGSVTERAVRNILLLPAELQPRQVISLIGMGGPSFPLANHDDHIHVGY